MNTLKTTFLWRFSRSFLVAAGGALGGQGGKNGSIFGNCLARL
jgi:hypothetical protein